MVSRELTESGAARIMSRLIDGFAGGVNRRKMRAVISCQHAGPRLDARGTGTGPGQRPWDRTLAVKDNRIDSQLWPTEVIEGVNQAWLKRVFSRPGPQEPEKGLPGLSEENPNGPRKGTAVSPGGE